MSTMIPYSVQVGSVVTGLGEVWAKEQVARFWHSLCVFTPCAAWGQVIVLSILTQEGFSLNLMTSSTALQLNKSSWPSQILLVYLFLGKALPTPETQTLPAPSHTPYSSRYTVEHAYSTSALVLCLR